MPTHEGVGPDDCEDLKDRREPTIKLNEEPAIVVRKLGPAPHLAAQDDQLMSKRRILRLKPALRLEYRDLGRNRAARSFRQLRGFHHVINSEKIFRTTSSTVTTLANTVAEIGSRAAAI